MSNYRDRQNEVQAEESAQPNPYAGDKATSGSNVLPLLALILAFFLPFASIVLGHVSLSQMKKGTMSAENRGLALAGLILGYVFTVLTALAFAAYLLYVVTLTTNISSY